MSKICKAIDFSKTFVCFITKGYIAKVDGKDMTDKNLIEFTYTLRRKHPNLMIPVILEPDIVNTESWKGILGLALGDGAEDRIVNFADDENFDAKCDALFQRVTMLSRKDLVIAPSLLVSSSLLHQLNKPRKEQQFFQWMSRSTKIDERKRLVYCASLVKLGVTSVFQLAKLVSGVVFMVPISVMINMFSHCMKSKDEDCTEFSDIDWHERVRCGPDRPGGERFGIGICSYSGF